jgi:hypothetical protein
MYTLEMTNEIGQRTVIRCNVFKLVKLVSGALS